MTDHSQVQRADAQFKKVQRAEDGRKAMAEYEAERIAIREKTARLRALRLAREAELREAVKPAPAKPVSKAKRTSKAA